VNSRNADHGPAIFHAFEFSLRHNAMQRGPLLAEQVEHRLPLSGEITGFDRRNVGRLGRFCHQ
jgi:hypothetical protein